MNNPTEKKSLRLLSAAMLPIVIRLSNTKLFKRATISENHPKKDYYSKINIPCNIIKMKKRNILI